MVTIHDCGRTVAGDLVAFDIRWDGDLPAAGSVVWSMVISSDDGGEEVCLGYERVDGEFAVQFVGNPQSQRRSAVDEDADVGDREVTARFPANVVGVAVEWPVWKAQIIVDGEVVASQVAASS